MNKSNEFKSLMALVQQANEPEKPDINQKYKELVSSFKYEPHYVDRDGDLFNVKCPVCGSPNTYFIGWGFFICGRKHVFSIDTEDGVRSESELSEESKKRVLGDDLQKDGKDSHGHEEYLPFHKDDKAPFVFEFYFGWDTDKEQRTFDQAKYYVNLLEEKIEKYSEQFYRFYNPIKYWYVELKEAAEGYAGGDVVTQPTFMQVKKAILLMEKIKEWNKQIAGEDDSRHYSLYLFRKGR